MSFKTGSPANPKYTKQTMIEASMRWETTNIDEIMAVVAILIGNAIMTLANVDFKSLKKILVMVHPGRKKTIGTIKYELIQNKSVKIEKIRRLDKPNSKTSVMISNFLVFIFMKWVFVSKFLYMIR